MLLHPILSVWYIYLSASYAIQGSQSSLHSILYENENNEKNADKLTVHGNRAYVGGTNFFISLWLNSKGELLDIQRINFTSTTSNHRNCKDFSPDKHCENTVRVLEVLHDGEVLLCGTNSNDPKCWYFNSTNAIFKEAKLDASTWMTKSANGSTTSLYYGNNSSDSELYIGSVKTNGGAIFAKKLPISLKSAKNWLDEPEYLGTYALGKKKDKIYIFFNEKSTNFVGASFDRLNKKRDYYSMVARVCKNDKGGTWEKETWMTFIKARLICPWPGNDLENEANLYYNELVSTSAVDDILFGLFLPRRKWNLTTYAICQFSVKDIDATLEGNSFHSKQTEYFNKNGPENIVFRSKGDHPPFYPGKCPNKSTYVLKSNFEQFVLDNTLVKMSVLPKGGRPFYVRTSEEPLKFILAQTLKWCKIIFLLSERGSMKKIILYPNMSIQILCEKQLFKEHVTILAAKLSQSKRYILATTEKSVMTLPVEFCSDYADCQTCNADPQCQWEMRRNGSWFECNVASFPERRTCSSKPERPWNLEIITSNDEVKITWRQLNGSPLVFNIIFITMKKTNQLKIYRKSYTRSLTIRRSNFEDGCFYEVVVKTVNRTSLSEGKVAVFSTALQVPKIAYSVMQGGNVEIFWSKVPGAKRYLMKLIDADGKLLQEFSLLSTLGRFHLCFSNMEVGRQYTATVNATSEDGIESIGSIQIMLVSPLYTGAASCNEIIPALIVFVALFLGSFLIILHNNWTIRPKVSLLKDDTGRCSYKRRYLLIWNKNTEKQHHVKGDNTIMSSSSA